MENKRPHGNPTQNQETRNNINYKQYNYTYTLLICWCWVWKWPRGNPTQNPSYSINNTLVSQVLKHNQVLVQACLRSCDTSRHGLDLGFTQTWTHQIKDMVWNIIEPNTTITTEKGSATRPTRTWPRPTPTTRSRSASCRGLGQI